MTILYNLLISVIVCNNVCHLDSLKRDNYNIAVSLRDKKAYSDIPLYCKSYYFQSGPLTVFCMKIFIINILSHASEVRSPKNHLGSRQRQDMGQGSSRLIKNGKIRTDYFTCFTKAG